MQVVTQAIKDGIVRRCIERYKFTPQLKTYVDDFFGGEKTKKLAWFVYRFVKDVLAKIRMPTKTKKDRDPHWQNVLLGFEFCTRMERKLVRVSAEKCDKYLYFLNQVLRGDLNRKLLERVHGQLCHCSQVTPFLKSVLPTLSRRLTLERPTPFTNWELKGLRMWRRCLTESWWYSLKESTGDLPLSHGTFWTDASSNGFGAYWYPQGYWISQEWQDMPIWAAELMVDISEDDDVSINSLEFLAMLIPLYIMTNTKYGFHVRNTCCKWRCDNKSAIFWVIKEKAKSPLPALFVYLWNGISRANRLRHAIKYIDTHDNYVADQLSRGRWRHLSLAPEKRIQTPWDWVFQVLNEPDTVWTRPCRPLKKGQRMPSC